ncbi:MAG: hypothetical protein IPJ19_13705 [Planctomycetes bacterium]|nr:hypothetical protein [Planctomycetota bacterium]
MLTRTSSPVSRALRTRWLPTALAAGACAASAALAAAQCPGWDVPFGSAAQPGVVQALQAFDEGSGPALFAGGQFSSLGGVPASSVARWNGTHWSAAGAITTIAVNSFAVHDDGSGPALYAGGGFGADIGGQVWRWNGGAWSQVGSTSSASSIYALASFDDGTGPALYSASWGQVLFPPSSYTQISRLSGSSWPVLLSCTNSAPVFRFATFDDGLGAGPALYIGGSFTNMTYPGGTIAASGLVRWDGTTLTAIPLAPAGFTAPFVGALCSFDDGSGPALVGGQFGSVNGVAAHNIARLQAGSWSALGLGVGTNSDSVSSIAAYHDGSGPAVFAIGSFLTAGGNPAQRIARWDGLGWSALSTGLAGGSPIAIAAFDDGIDGDADLYAGGYFTSAGGFTANKIARWFGCSTEVFCAGDGTQAACPCANFGAAGHGCENSAQTGGAPGRHGKRDPGHARAHLERELASSLSIFLQGDATVAPTAFGDGLRCTAGNLKRLYIRNAASGTASAPQAGDPSITARSAALGDPIAPRSTRYYQVYYRDPQLGFCAAPQGSSFNVSQAVRIVW